MDLIIKAAMLLGKVKDAILIAEDVAAAALKFAPQVETAIKIFTGELTGQAALDDIDAKEADIDEHFAHMEMEAARLGQP